MTGVLLYVAGLILLGAGAIVYGFKHRWFG